MKKVKLILTVVTAMLLLGVSSVNAQEKSTEMVIIRITEGGGAGLVTIDSEGKTSKIDLKMGQSVNISAHNGVLIQKELKKWEQQGYKITNFSTSGDGIFRTTIILEK